MNKKLIGTAIGAGVTYLMRNKSARDKLIDTVKQFASGRGKTADSHPSSSTSAGSYPPGKYKK
ncbi:hypothetical protein M3223_00790 [Paenibacillus pasadenensis]|uniref:hypothetical protein n=1 Tax=Paenibacillus pasadenensis TaxID=217090 RepID=UPI0020401F0D|nr:hypothetical protein [Paenibacillus pasadenensis]MCM3745880.1 hypothetical protein [Paenibacillus pasadenensis]